MKGYINKAILYIVIFLMSGCAQYQQFEKRYFQNQENERAREKASKEEKKTEYQKNEGSEEKFKEKLITSINNVKGLPEDEKQRIIKGEFWIGMTATQAKLSNYIRHYKYAGSDDYFEARRVYPKIRRTEYRWGIHEQWEVFKYENMCWDDAPCQFLYFENGILTVIQDQ